MTGESAEARRWRARLTPAPTWAIEAELARRRAQRPEPIELPGLTVDPLSGEVAWRGTGYVFAGRQLEVLYALAILHRQGRHFAIAAKLGALLFAGWDEQSRLANLRVHVSTINRQAPGLIVKRHARGRAGDGRRVSYGLAAGAMAA